MFYDGTIYVDRTAPYAVRQAQQNGGPLAARRIAQAQAGVTGPALPPDLGAPQRNDLGLYAPGDDH
ncbi:hypothetical protein [Curtobacterium sp. MCBD17_003]|uniref:hypothetical protein n=1 Tax=Curtobacterium sp. MCBD17_003 TaxID=2175667 RepID=UPI000DA9E2A7|nr:hypothetical protein [Curtobacterium sp. MCBD17_003]WIE53442.1 hypothetical protein DEI88_009740 [Curtobacterium sp. MCBD17_003]